MKLIIVLALISVACALERQIFDEWEKHVAKYNRKYQSAEHSRKAFENFAREHKRVKEHNSRFRSGLETYEADLNQFSDMSPEERAQYTGLNYQPHTPARNARSISKQLWISTNSIYYNQIDADTNLPSTALHCKYAGVVKNQGQCGSCYSFAGTKVIEMNLAKKYNLNYTLSPQQLVDCSTPFGNNGCDGGFPTFVYDYYIKTGISFVQESQYPYKAAVQTKTATDCSALAAKSTIKAKVTAYVVAKENDIQAVKTLLNQGPCFGAIYVNPTTSPLFSYKSGIVTSSETNEPNHAITITGYTTINGTEVFRILNSWGSTWGDKGFAYIKATDLKIASSVYYPNITLTA